jgi:hypothetical protein
MQVITAPLPQSVVRVLGVETYNIFLGYVPGREYMLIKQYLS